LPISERRESTCDSCPIILSKFRGSTVTTPFHEHSVVPWADRRRRSKAALAGHAPPYTRYTGFARSDASSWERGVMATSGTEPEPLAPTVRSQ
jgi:hypothetical protein